MTASSARSPAAPGAVIVATPWYRPTVGGVVEVADRLLRMLPAAGVETHLFVCDGPSCDGRIRPSGPPANVWQFPVPCSFFSRPGARTLAGTLIRGCRALWELLRFVRARGVRTAILLYPVEHTWVFAVAGRLGAVRLIASCHGNDVVKYGDYRRPGRWLLRCVLGSSDAITVCADHLRQAIAGILPRRRPPVRLIPNCVDADSFTPPARRKRTSAAAPTVVHVSNFAPKKRAVDIVEAFAMPAVPPASRLVMVGAGPDLPRAAERAGSLALGDRVEFVGAVEDVRPYLRRADLFVLASESEGDPLVLLEAMACGLAWVSTPWGAAASLPAGECGLLVPPRSPDRLAAAMGELLSDPRRLRAMGRRGRRRVERDYTQAAYLRRHLELIQQLDRRPETRFSARPI